MSGEVEHPAAQAEKATNTRMVQIKSRFAEVFVKRVFRPAPFPSGGSGRQPGYGVGIETKHFTGFTRRQLGTVCDDICSHRRPAFAISFVNVLNDRFALIPTR